MKTLIKDKKDYIYLALMLVCLFLFASQYRMDLKMVQHWKNNPTYTIGMVNSERLQDGKILQRVKVKYMLNSIEYEAKSFSFSPKKGIPKKGEKCLLILSKEDKEKIGIVAGVDVSDFEYGQDVTTVVDHARVKLSIWKTPTYQ